MNLQRKILAWVVLSVCILQSAAAEESKDHRQNRLLNPGLNLNRYFEDASAKQPSRYEIEQIKNQGFRSVRIPVNWLKQVDGNQIRPRFLAALKKTVRDCLENDLRVIINVHHFDEMKQDPDRYEPFLIALWSIIAHEFSEFDDRLLFELFNEPNKQLDIERWNQSIVKLHQIVRQFAPERTIIIGSAEHSGFWSLDRLVLPEDDKNIIVTVHYYSPMEFSHQGAHWIAERKRDKPLAWQGSKKLLQDFEKIADYQKKSGRPVNIGEFGVYRHIAPKQDVLNWNHAVVSACLKCGFSYHYWEHNGGFGLYRNGKWDPDLTRVITAK